MVLARRLQALTDKYQCLDNLSSGTPDLRGLELRSAASVVVQRRTRTRLQGQYPRECSFTQAMLLRGHQAQWAWALRGICDDVRIEAEPQCSIVCVAKCSAGSYQAMCARVCGYMSL
jgi:hypothetical protein